MNQNIPESLGKLEKSVFRSKFKLSGKDIAYIQQKGMNTIRAHALDFISSRIAPANPKNDGKQTPMKNHPVFIAQHATATCCRGCIQKWHGIKKGRPLSESEITLIVWLLMEWISRQLEKAGSDD